MPTHRELGSYCKISYDQATASTDGVEFLHVPDDDLTIIITRGTEIKSLWRGLVDMLRNVAIWRKDVKEVEGHAGFSQGWIAIYDDVLEIIKANPSKPIVIGGHSAGGAMMAIACYHLLFNGYIVQELVTWGAPPALILKDMNPDILARMREITTQYQHARDPVPGYLRWTKYKHINYTFIGGKRRGNYFIRRLRFHGIDSYLDVMIKEARAKIVEGWTV